MDIRNRSLFELDSSNSDEDTTTQADLSNNFQNNVLKKKANHDESSQNILEALGLNKENKLRPEILSISKIALDEIVVTSLEQPQFTKSEDDTNTSSEIPGLENEDLSLNHTFHSIKKELNAPHFISSNTPDNYSLLEEKTVIVGFQNQHDKSNKRSQHALLQELDIPRNDAPFGFSNDAPKIDNPKTEQIISKTVVSNSSEVYSSNELAPKVIGSIPPMQIDIFHNKKGNNLSDISDQESEIINDNERFKACAAPLNVSKNVSGSFYRRYSKTMNFFRDINSSAINIQEFVDSHRSQLRSFVLRNEIESAVSENREMLGNFKPKYFSLVFEKAVKNSRVQTQQRDYLYLLPSSEKPAATLKSSKLSKTKRIRKVAGSMSDSVPNFEAFPVTEVAVPYVASIPRYSAWIPLKMKVSCPDDPLLRYVCYFGDNDYEDVMADVYEQDKVDTQGKNESKERIAELYEQDDVVIEQYLINYALDRLLNPSEMNDLETSLAKCDVPTSGGARGGVDTLEEDANESFAARCFRLSKSLRKRMNLDVLEKPQRIDDTEANLMDSFRSLFCRVCFVYDCPNHGGSSYEADFEKAIWERQKTWMKGHFTPPETPCGRNCYLDNSQPVVDLNQSDMMLCAKTIIVCRGSSCKAAELLNFDCSQVHSARMLTEQLEADNLPILDLVCNVDMITTKNIRNEFSKKSFAQQFIKSLSNSETAKKLSQEKKKGLLAISSHNPCVHLGPCSSSNDCSCTLAGNFCTKHCACSVYCSSKEKNGICRNFFPGCRCSASCGTKQCPCFSTSRVCDPDLCFDCVERNSDKICQNKVKKLSHLVLAESGVEGAGWGIFSRYAVTQGKIISDYLGEVISQEEAERRGRYYDKVNRSYLFNVNSDQVVDAFRKGNKIKFANHSKRPNCEVRIFTIDRQQHIIFFAKRDIEAGEELFFDYHYEQEQKSAYVKKNGVVVDWMRDAKRANTVRKRPIESQLINNDAKKKRLH